MRASELITALQQLQGDPPVMAIGAEVVPYRIKSVTTEQHQDEQSIWLDLEED